MKVLKHLILPFSVIIRSPKTGSLGALEYSPPLIPVSVSQGCRVHRNDFVVMNFEAYMSCKPLYQLILVTSFGPHKDYDDCLDFQEIEG